MSLALGNQQGGSMGFGEAISAGFSNYVNFSDRASRSEYWYWILFIILAEIVTSIIDYAIGAQVVTGIFGLATFLPSLGLAIRRLHDLDRTGWWVLLWFIPIIGWIILLIWFCTRGTIGPNRFGPDPLGGMASAMPRAA
jgi:uncharacterized membrane protein YhaH (DUF805 family)